MAHHCQYHPIKVVGNLKDNRYKFIFSKRTYEKCISSGELEYDRHCFFIYILFATKTFFKCIWREKIQITNKIAMLTTLS